MAPVFPPLFRPLPVPSPLDFRVSFLCGSVLHVFGFSWIVGQSRYSILGFQVIILPLFISLSSFSLFRHVRSGRMRRVSCVRPLVAGGIESLVGRAVQGCCVVHVVVVVDPSLCIGWLWSWSKMYIWCWLLLFLGCWYCWRIFHCCTLYTHLPGGGLRILLGHVVWFLCGCHTLCMSGFGVYSWSCFYWEHSWSGFEDGASLGPC